MLPKSIRSNKMCYEGPTKLLDANKRSPFREKKIPQKTFEIIMNELGESSRRKLKARQIYCLEIAIIADWSRKYYAQGVLGGVKTISIKIKV